MITYSTHVKLAWEEMAGTLTRLEDLCSKVAGTETAVKVINTLIRGNPVQVAYAGCRSTVLVLWIQAGDDPIAPAVLMGCKRFLATYRAKGY